MHTHEFIQLHTHIHPTGHTPNHTHTPPPHTNTYRIPNHTHTEPQTHTAEPEEDPPGTLSGQRGLTGVP